MLFSLFKQLNTQAPGLLLGTFLEQFIAVHITLQTQLHRVLELMPASAAGVMLSIMPKEVLQVGGKDWHWSWRLLARRMTECQLFV